jgi:uncharacterized phiE125 gp8 family phage protein
MAVRLITPPAVEPVTLEEAKLHLKVDHSEDDLLIGSYIEGARIFAEKFTARAFITQTWELVLDEFPADEIKIPLPPLQSVESVKYDDADGFEQTLATSGYSVDTANQPGWVVPVTTGWPSSTFEGINSVRIRFVAGYDPGTGSPVDLAENVPTSLKNAILLHAGMLYANRESIVVGTIAVGIPTGGILHILRQFRVALGMA